MQTLPPPDKQFNFKDSSLSIWKTETVVQLFSEKIATSKTATIASQKKHNQDERQIINKIYDLNQQIQVSEAEWLDYFKLFYHHNSWQLLGYTNEDFIAFIQMTEVLFELLINNSDKKFTKELQHIFEMHLRQLSAAIEIDQPIKGNWREVLATMIGRLSAAYLNTIFYKAFVRQNEYTKASYLLPSDNSRDGYVSRDPEFMEQLEIGSIYTKLFTFWGLLNIDSKQYIDTLITYVEDVIVVDYETWSKFGAAKYKLYPLLYYYYHKNEYAIEQLLLLLRRLKSSEDSNALLMFKDLKTVISKIEVSYDLDLSYFEDLIQCYRQIGFTNLSTQDIQKLLLTHNTIFDFKSANFYELSRKTSFVLDELLTWTMGLSEYGNIHITNTKKYTLVKNALEKALKLKLDGNKNQKFWLDFFIERAEKNIAAYELALGADISKILKISQELVNDKILSILPTEQEIKEIIFDSNPKQKKKIVKDVLEKMGIIIRFDAEAGLVPLPYDSLNQLLHSSAAQELPNLQFATIATLLDDENASFNYKVWYVYQGIAFQFEEVSSSDYYSNSFVQSFNQLLATCAVKKQFIEKKTSDQTYLFYYMEPKQLLALDKKYTLFKKKKK